jgi:hypothetical protein
MVSYSTAKLGEVDDTYYYGVNCSSCLRSQRISPVRLRALLGDDYRLLDVLKRLKCGTYRSKKVTVTFLAPQQAGSSLSHLFQQQAT